MVTSKYPLGRRISDAATMFVVLLVSLLLLVYVAYGEAKLTYERFQGDKLSGQVHVLQKAMQAPLLSGLELRQFVGFNTLAEPALKSDKAIGSLVVYDDIGNIVFKAGDPAVLAKLPAPHEYTRKDGRSRAKDGIRSTTIIGKSAKSKDYELLSANGHYRIIVPLSNKFEDVGALAISMAETVVTDRVDLYFQRLFYAAPVAAFIYALFIGLLGPRRWHTRVPWAQLAFGIVFIVSSAGVIATLITLYSDGAQAKSRALAGSLGQRLSDVVAFNISIDEIQGLDRTFGEYLKLNPDISAASLTVDNRIVIHTDRNKIGQQWMRSESHYEYVVDLTPENSTRTVRVAVELPSNVVTGQITRSVKNFAALFIASAFLASLFFQLGGAVRRPMDEMPHDEADSSGGAIRDGPNEWMLNYVRPVFFLGVLLEHLTYAFLPQFVQGAVLDAGVSTSFASAPFVGFYLLFALTLVPAGYAAQRIGPKPLMYIGLLLAGSGLAVLAFYPDFLTIMAARCLSGVGQGLLFIGVQSYLLAVAPPGKKTQAAAIIVYGFQGGMISGMAVGSLLVGYMGTNGVFLLAAAIGLVSALYAVVAVPTISEEVTSQSSSAPARDLVQSLGQAVRNIDFLNTMATIGIPAKAVLTGVITFALPLLLAKSGYPQEDIGQIIMLYAISVVASSKFVAVHVDRNGDAFSVLLTGALVSGLGLALMGLSGTFDPAVVPVYTETILLVIGVLLIGAAHGFINAPVVTFVAESQLAQQIGTSTATATYRFLERVGHVAGPVIIGQLLIWTNFSWSAMGVVGFAIALLAVIFVIGAEIRPNTRKQQSRRSNPEGASNPMSVAPQP
ncbi:MAG: MFS transporter [Rhizobiales bacterium]|nr:MFS transporter [Hyphomicrobiales bacterium]